MTRHRGRPAFTLVECVVGIAVLAFAALLVAEISVQSLADRVRSDERLAATEAAANVLEAARATPWAELTSEWAAGRKPSEDLSARLHDAVLTVRVEPEKGRERVKRVAIELRWTPATSRRNRPVTAVALFADRAGGGS